MPVNRFKGLPNGFSVKSIVTREERAEHNELCHNGRTCISSDWSNIRWDNRLKSGNYFLYELLNDEGMPIATILLGCAEFTLNCRASTDYPEDYTNFKTLDQRPRILNGKAVVCYEVIPAGFGIHSDYKITREETKIAQEWYENLPLAEDYLDWNANDELVLVEAQRFKRERNNN